MNQQLHVIASNDIVYGRGSGRDLLLDILRPDVPLDPPRPLVIWIHGGGWVDGNRAPAPNVPLAEHGFVTASISYRFSGEAIFPAQIFDVKAAIRFLRANATEWGIDPARIGAWGHSAGGHLTALAAVTNGLPEFEGDGGNSGVDTRIQAAVPMSPPSDFLVDWFEGSGYPHREDIADVMSRLFGGLDLDNAESRELARMASPFRLARAGTPPMLVIHGTRDDVVPIAQGRILVDALKRSGCDASLLEIASDSHTLETFFTEEYSFEHPKIDPVVAFFDRVLGPVT